CAPEPAPAAPPAPTAVPAVPPSSGPAAAKTGEKELAPAGLTAKAIALPGVTGPAFLDYIAYERSPSRVWVPVGNTGSVDVYDTATGTFTRIDGFKTAERERNGKKRTAGPSAVSLGDGYAFIGNRASSEVCPIDTKTLKAAACVTLPDPTDGVIYVASAKEVWVTTPKASAVVVLDASTPAALKVKTRVKTEGEPEGYAVDDQRGRFFTNLEDKDRTLVIDVKTHAVTATWNPACGAEGPRGLAYDSARDFLVVACTDHLQVIDAGHGGALLGRLDTGAGVDNLDLIGGKLYVAAGKAARLTVATLDDQGRLTVVATGQTAEGARNAVADAAGNAYVADPGGARFLVLSPASP
ncbi:MAG: hypothetical protein ABI193_13545, partial [Minicystis sp.]